MKDFNGLTGEWRDALFETIYSFFELCDYRDSGETIEH